MSQINADSLSTPSGEYSTDMTNIINGSVRSWVKFDGADGTISSSYNVASITQTATGRFIIYFDTALDDANYAVFCTNSTDDDSSYAVDTGVELASSDDEDDPTLFSTSGYAIICQDSDGSQVSAGLIVACVLR